MDGRKEELFSTMNPMSEPTEPSSHGKEAIAELSTLNSKEPIGKLFSLKGKTAIVTGGGGGLGRGMALGLSAAGASLVISGRNAKALEKTAKELQQATGSPVKFAVGDVTKQEDRKRIIQTALEEYGRLDILVNGAGNQLRIPALDYTEAHWDSILDVQLKAVFFMCQEAVKQVIAWNGHQSPADGKLKIINIASLNSRFGFSKRTAYVAAKGGIVQLTKCLANEWASYGVYVNAMAPGYFRTEMTESLFSDPEWTGQFMSRLPLKRGGTPEDLAGLTVFLASAASDYITGETVYIDGGFSVC